MELESNDNLNKNIVQENEKVSSELIQMLDDVMNFNFWGFRHSYTRPITGGDTLPKVIYDSEWCRVRFSLTGGDLLHGFNMSVWYGRAHAPNEESVINFNEKKCWCWHTVDEAIYFLDDISPQEVINRFNNKNQWLPDASASFLQTGFAKKIKSKPELIATMHSELWKKYNVRLFELFDIRRPRLWDQYSQYIREFNRLKGSVPEITPQKDQIC